MRKADAVLANVGQDRTSDQFGSVLAGLIAKARSGDTAAATWLLDRFVPRERLRLTRPLPSPTSDPLAFVDELAARVADGELTCAEAARLSNLCRPMIVDEQLRTVIAELEGLRAQVEELQRNRLQVVK